MKPFSSLPFLRLLLPLTGGICIALWLRPVTSFYPALLPLFAIVIVLWRRSSSRKLRYGYFIAADLFLLTLGMVLVQHTDLSRRKNFIGKIAKPDTALCFTGWPSEIPVVKGKWLRCQITLYSAGNEEVQRHAAGKILAYFPPDTDPDNLRPGKMLLFRTRLVPAPRPMNPGEFDYGGWLADRNIFYTCFLRGDDFSAADVPQQINPLWKFGLFCRATVLERLRSSGIGPQAYAICAALLTGQDDDIDRDTMAAFAHSGTLHVLSVSGLHVGLVYLALGFVYGIFDRNRRHRLARLGFLLAGLWGFALFTGFAAPVLRAVIMFSLVGVGAIYFRNTARNQLNLLFVSAFFLLSFNPFFLVDVGFLLSYTAMIGLICITPWLAAFHDPRTYVGDVVWKSLCASMAATISTLPLTLFFFKQFPLWFFLCNLVVVPASSLLLLLSFLLACGLFFLAPVTDFIVSMLKHFIAWFNTPGAGYIDYIDFGLADMLFFSVILLLLAAALTTRKYRISVLTVSLLIVWQLVALINSLKAKTEQVLTVYQVSRAKAVTVKRRGKVQLYMDDTARFEFHVKPSLVAFNRPAITFSPFNLVSTDSASILFLDRPGKISGVEPASVKAIVLSGAGQLTQDVRTQWPGLQLVICDGSMAHRPRLKTAELCRTFGIRFHNTAEMGALQLRLSNETKDW